MIWGNIAFLSFILNRPHGKFTRLCRVPAIQRVEYDRETLEKYQSMLSMKGIQETLERLEVRLRGQERQKQEQERWDRDKIATVQITRIRRGK